MPPPGAPMGLEDGMRNLNISANGPRPGGGRAPIRGPQPGGRPPPGESPSSRGPMWPPPTGWDGRRGPMQQQNGPPPARGKHLNGLEGGAHGVSPPGGPPRRTNTWNYNRDGNGDPTARHPNHASEESPPAMGVQRSMTMPNNQAQPQYTAYNPTKHAARVPYNDMAAASPAYDSRQPQQNWPRESVGALLDSYYHNSAGYYGYHDQNSMHSGYQDTNDPQVWTRKPVQDADFARQAHRSRSQPNLRNQPDGAYDRGPEMLAKMPPLPPNNGYGQTGGAMPAALPAGSPASQGGARRPTNAMAPQRRLSAAGADSLPIHPSPSQIREAENASQYSNNSLPAHPPPIRPGLMQEQPGHPPPVRQYATERTSVSSAQSIVEPPITIQELEQLQHAAKMNPGDPRLQLTLAKKMVEASVVLTSEGGRADAKTSRRIRENYIFDAHKIIKRLTNSVRSYVRNRLTNPV